MRIPTPVRWAPARLGLIGALAATVMGCKGDGVGDDDDVTVTPSIEITSPADGGTVVQGDDTTLSAAGDDGLGNDLDLAGASWSASTWTAQGNNLVVTDLPVGTWDLTVRATVGDAEISDTVSITVEEPPPVDYEGELAIDGRVESGFGDYDFVCEHRSLAFTVLGDGSLAGTGACYAVVQDFGFTLEGQVDGTVVTGTMTSDQAAEPMEFTGERLGDDSITVSFDKTWENGGNTLRLFGSWTAWPLTGN